MPAPRWRHRPATQFVAVLLAIAVLDLSAVAYSVTASSDDAPPLPPFTASSSTALVNRGVDAYAPSPDAFGLTTTPGRPVIPDNGHVRSIKNGHERLDPDSSLRYALAALVTYSTKNDERWLSRARRAVEDVLATQKDGLVPHTSSRLDVNGKPLPRGWVSAETQGLLLSVLSRLSNATQNPRWQAKADRVFDSLVRFRGGRDSEDREYDPWTSFVDKRGYLWFEKMPQGTTPTRSMTGHLFAVIGTYDYAEISTGQRRSAADDLFAAGATTGLMYLPRVWFPFHAAWTSPARTSRSRALHHVLEAQLGALTRMTGSPAFKYHFETFRGDLSLPGYATTGLVPKHEIDVYAGEGAKRALPPTGPPLTPDPAGAERSARAAAQPDARLASALTALASFSTSKRAADLQHAVQAVTGVLDETTRGLVPHTFPQRDLSGRDLAVPWYSAQTQGLLLSALVRLEAATGQERWADEAGAVFATFQRSRAYPGNGPTEPPDIWLSSVADDRSVDNLWFEKYGRRVGDGKNDFPSYVVDAHLAALFGIYDYWRMTGSAQAVRLFDGGASTLAGRLSDIRRPGRVSYTALQSDIYRLEHHRVVTRQLALLSDVTGDRTFARYSRQFARDAS